jgi:starch phosphorylase
MDVGLRLRDLARNLYWTWQPRMIAVFRDLDPQLWREANHNPVEFLERLPPETLRRRADAIALEARIIQAFHEMHNYLAEPDTWAARYAGPLHARPVAYFSAEFGLHESLPTYAGGLGVLAGDHLKAASDLGVPLVGVGLFYASGYFHQHLDSSGWQQEDYFDADVRHLPLEWATGPDDRPLVVRVETRGSEIAIRIGAAQVGRNRLVLLDTNVDGNSPEDRALAARLYGGDHRTRIRQELVLGVGGLRALEALGIRPGVLHLNEGHSAFAVLEMARRLMQRDGRPFDAIRETVAQQSVFTTHTPVPEGHDRFDAALVEETVGPLRDALRISPHDLLALGRVDPTDGGEPFCMTVLGLKMSRARNAVSALHGRTTRAMWKGLWPGRHEDAVPIGHITNGVHLASWLAIPMVDLYARAPGVSWDEHVPEAGTWEAVERIDDVEFWEEHQVLKAQLVEFVCRRVRAQEEARGGQMGDCLNLETLTIGVARRFAGYKRADLLLRDMDRLARLVNDPKRPVQFVFSGKAHPANDEGKRIIQRLFQAMHDPRFVGRIVFIENYDINVCRHLVQGVDLWLNTPRRPLEACGTSGQKTVLNGGLNLSTLDGWWAEGYDGANGFAIGDGSEHADAARQDDRDAAGLFDVLEKVVVPLYYTRDAAGLPRGWIARQKHAIRTLPCRFNAQRMVMDYTLRCYLPAAGALPAAFPAL